MTATVIAFPNTAQRAARHPKLLTQDWLDRHLPLINAALDLLSADDLSFARRCRALAAAEKSPQLTDLVTQLNDLGEHLADVADALSLTERVADPLCGGNRPCQDQGHRHREDDRQARSRGPQEGGLEPRSGPLGPGG